VRILPKGEGPVTGLVTVFSPCKINVTTVAGGIVVSSGGETRTVAEKETYSVIPEVTVLAVRNYISPNDPTCHQSHAHKACGLGKDPTDSGRFRKIGLCWPGRGGCPRGKRVFEDPPKRRKSQ
jgi:hypothetical protein